MHYRPSQHQLSVPCEDGVRLFHTMTGEVLLLEPGDSWESCRTDLIARRFLVPDNLDENQYADEIRSIIRQIHIEKKRTHFTIFTTTDCNARCFYCYEHGRRRISMEDQTAHDVSDYIRRVSGGERISIRWFGGEPLYHMRAIRIICSDLSESGALFQSSMVTNGLYLTEDIVKEARQKWHLARIQITLDGTAQVYRRTKAFIDGGDNPYQTVLKNIRSCLQNGIQVSIRLNVNQYNEEDMLCLCDELVVLFSQDIKIRVYAYAIRNAKGKTTEKDMAAVLRVEEKLLDTGLLRPGKISSKFKINHCMADDDSSETILPDGKIGRCEHFSDTEFTGSIYSSEQDQEIIQSWKEQMEAQKECKNCPLYPRCIRLKKCEWIQQGCSAVDREIEIRRLTYQIRQLSGESLT